MREVAQPSRRPLDGKAEDCDSRRVAEQKDPPGALDLDEVARDAKKVPRNANEKSKSLGSPFRSVAAAPSSRLVYIRYNTSFPRSAAIRA